MSSLINLFSAYSTRYPSQGNLVQDFIDFLNSKTEMPFARENLTRHITASAWVLNAAHSKTLLTHHRKLNIWVQLGGHCDGNSNVVEAALREAEEESGILGVKLVTTDIFDIDKHLIPGRADEPEHHHYDIRFLVEAPHENFLISPESKDLKWFRYDDPFFSSDSAESIKRMHSKWVASLKLASPAHSA